MGIKGGECPTIKEEGEDARHISAGGERRCWASGGGASAVKGRKQRQVEKTRT